MKNRSFATVLSLLISSQTAFSLPVYWTDWTTGTAGAAGSAQGVINIGSETITVSYTGEIAFIQTSGGVNYWNPTTPYISSAVDNAPGTTDIIALSSKTSKTLTFSKPVDNLFFAVVSLNGNGYVFDSEFTIESYGHGYWGNGTLTKTELGGGKWRTSGTGEPHGVIRFTQPVQSITWTSDANEFWNGFTVGTYGIAPEGGASIVLLGLGGFSLALVRRRNSNT